MSTPTAPGTLLSSPRWCAGPRRVPILWRGVGVHRRALCLFWTARSRSLRWLIGSPTSATILLISRVYDPATPHSGAVAASQTLANARLLTIDGWGHSDFEGGLSTCAYELMASYLIDRQLPAPDTTCREDTPPFSDRLMDAAGEATPAPSPELTP